MSMAEQLSNIGSEVGRSAKWQGKDEKTFYGAVTRALELFDLTFLDIKNRRRLREVARARELWVDYFVGTNVYHSTDEMWQKYFYSFNYAARVLK